MKRVFFILSAGLLPLLVPAQSPDSIYMPNIHTPQLFLSGNQVGYPVLRLSTADQLELDFDDLDADVKNYYYTWQLCNADWTPSEINPFDYIKGFPQDRITDYQLSSVALTRYTHYQMTLPTGNCQPTHSGNYMLKVFLDGDTSKLAFTRRLLILDNKVNIRHQVLQPLDLDKSHTYQRLQLSLNTAAVNPPNPLDQIRVVVLQNDRWDNAISGVKPTFYINNKLEYTGDNDFLFPGGNEWRWIDLQSFRYQSERIAGANYGKTATEIFMKPDKERNAAPYYYYKDYDGYYFIQTTESINPNWQTDYATVHFYYVPPGNTPYADKDLYVLGRFTGGFFSDSTRMTFNADKGRYEVSFLLKQGYYNYTYVTADKTDPTKKVSFDITEGDHLETENSYRILIYYRPLGARADELVGMSNFTTPTGN